MGFDFEKYKAAGWEPRIEDVPVPVLKEYFENGEDPIWKIRNLKAVEKARCEDAVRRNAQGLVQLLEAFTYANSAIVQSDISNDIKDKINDLIPGSIVLQYELVMAGSINPKIENKADLILFGENHPDILKDLAERILTLTGLGALPGKQKPCGETNGSGQV